MAAWPSWMEERTMRGQRWKGVNLGGWFSQVDAIEEKDPSTFAGIDQHVRTFLGAPDFQRIASWGFDHVRLPVDWQIAFDEGLKPREDRLRLLDEAVSSIRAQGLEILLDLHRCPGHDFHEGTTKDQPLFSDPAALAGARKVLAVLAERYGSDPGTALELLNEPTAPDAATWNRVARNLFHEVRAHAPRATIVVGSNRWNSATEFAHLEPMDDDNVLYSFHFYNPVLFTHQKAPWIVHEAFHETRSWPGTYVLPPEADHRLPMESGTWDRDRLARCLQAVVDFREKYGLPVSCDEFGVYKAGPARADQLAWIRDLLGLFGQHGIGWTYWNYRNLDFGLVSRGESLFAADPCYDNPERSDRELVELLLGA